MEKVQRPRKWKRETFTRSNETVVAPIQSVDFDTIQPERAGGILLIKNEQGAHYFMGRDRKFQEFTDFGGGISYKRDRNPLNAALREIYEESLGVFNIKPDLSNINVQESLVAYNSRIVVFLFVMEGDSSQYISDFEERVARFDNSEVDQIVMFDPFEIRMLVRGTLVHQNRVVRIYGRIRNIVEDLLKRSL